MNVIVLPTAWVLGRVGEDDRVGVDKAEFTTTSLFILLVVSGEYALSVTKIQ